MIKTSSYDTILVTGGTGTFGHAFVKHAFDTNLAKTIRIVSRDELKQQKMRALFSEHSARLRFYLGDVKDRENLVRNFQGVDVVIHAAAYKQLPRSFGDFQAFKLVNVDGTENVCTAAHMAGVKRVVMLSSDKACASTSPYGTTKSMAEWTALSANVLGDCRFTCLRYGNVLDSRGSVLQVWRRQAAEGKVLTVTHPAMTRFWMTIDQAVELTMDALQFGRGGEIFIPADIMRGKVVDLLQREFPGRPWEKVGKHGYEKLHETLVHEEEADRTVFCGRFYVILPPKVEIRWLPWPYGMLPTEGISVGPNFSYSSNGYGKGILNWQVDSD